MVLAGAVSPGLSLTAAGSGHGVPLRGGLRGLSSSSPNSSLPWGSRNTSSTLWDEKVAKHSCLPTNYLDIVRSQCYKMFP